ncbi:MAG: ABC transporter substrate-binding protein [Deltaproteobacteria bacterium]|nr:ABC transporter substrate-binding protein [Deltaproteobacteria bacterium]
MNHGLAGRWIWVLGFISAALFLCPRVGVNAERESVNVHIPSFDISVIPIYIAKEKGYFSEERLEPSLILASPGVGINGLVAGNFHFSASAGSASTAIARNMPLKVVLINTFKPAFWIYTRENIKSPLQLKGKKLAVSSLGGLSHTLARLALKRAGLDPDREVVMIAAGTTDIRLAALQSGVVDGAVLNAPGKFKAKKAGLSEVLFIGEHIDSLSGGIATTSELIHTRPDTVQRFVTGSVKGLKYFLANRQGSIQSMAKYMKIDMEMAREVYEMSIPMFTDGGAAGEDFMKNEVQLQAGVLGLKEVPPFGHPFDMSFALKANQRLKNWTPR